jgi:redox-sensitive bicupin YhaK (pirin superfamily)
MPDSTRSLREKAEAATPGPWKRLGDHRFIGKIGRGHDEVACLSGGEDAAHIAAWHPGVALAALRVIEAAEAMAGPFPTMKDRGRLEAALRDWREAK